MEKPSAKEAEVLFPQITRGWRNVEKETVVPLVLTDIEGQVPHDLVGTFLRNGPGVFSVGDTVLAHPIDGDGLVASLCFEAGVASFSCRFVNTRQHAEETREGKLLYNGLMGTKAGGSAQPGWRDPSHTNVLHVGGRLLTLHEYALPHALDPFTLQTIGPDSLRNNLELKSMSAHWRYEPETDITVTVAFRSGILGNKPKVSFYEWDSDLNLVQAKRGISVPGLDYVHDFCLFPDYYLVHITPFVNTDDETVLSGLTPGETMRFHASRPSQFALIGRHNEDVLLFETEPCHIFHFALARQVDHDTFKFSACCLPTGFNMNFKDGVFLSNVADAPAQFFEFVLCLSKQTCSRQLCRGLTKTTGEFPTTNPFRNCIKLAQNSPRTEVFYFMGSQEGRIIPFSDIVKYNVHTGEVLRWHSDGVVGEPCFVPRLGKLSAHSGAEDDGWLISQVYNLKDERSSFVILDASDLSFICRINIPWHLPYAFHTSFSEQVFLRRTAL